MCQGITDTYVRMSSEYKLRWSLLCSKIYQLFLPELLKNLTYYSYQIISYESVKLMSKMHIKETELLMSKE